MAVTREVFNRAHGDAGQRQVHDDLRQALVAVFGGARGAHQRNHVLAVVGVGGPDLLAVEHKALVVGRGTRLHAGQVRARIGLAHANAKERLATAHARNVELLLCLGAVFQDQRRALAVGNPVRAHGRAEVEELLDQHIPCKGAAPAAAIFRRQRDPEPTLGGQPAAELGAVAAPGAGTDVRGDIACGLGQKGAHLGAQGFVLRRDARERE